VVAGRSSRLPDDVREMKAVEESLGTFAGILPSGAQTYPWSRQDTPRPTPEDLTVTHVLADGRFTGSRPSTVGCKGYRPA
jgi:hypothetical protein